MLSNIPWPFFSSFISGIFPNLYSGTDATNDRGAFTYFHFKRRGRDLNSHHATNVAGFQDR